MTREEFHQLVDAKYDEIDMLDKQPTFLEFEQEFVELWTELGRQVAEKKLGADKSKDRRKKSLTKPPLD
jgi:hypothetical protein